MSNKENGTDYLVRSSHNDKHSIPYTSSGNGNCLSINNKINNALLTLCIVQTSGRDVNLQSVGCFANYKTIDCYFSFFAAKGAC